MKTDHELRADILAELERDPRVRSTEIGVIVNCGDSVSSSAAPVVGGGAHEIRRALSRLVSPRMKPEATVTSFGIPHSPGAGVAALGFLPRSVSCRARFPAALG